jgi:DNA transformation protein and related proteins
MPTAPKSPTPPFVEHCVELLSPLGRVRCKRMFGGWGLYVDELFIALIAFERLYLKVDDNSRARFEAAGCVPFVYEGDGRRVTMSYWTAPDEALDSPALMQPWARSAQQAALVAKSAKAVKAVKAKTKSSTASPTSKVNAAPKLAAPPATKKTAPKKTRASRA